MTIKTIFTVLVLLSFQTPLFAIGQYHVNTDTAVVHHTASPDWSVERIRTIHVKEKGWRDIGYNFVIRANGSVEKGRPLTIPGAHAKGRNQYVGIALTGYDTFTPEQITSLKQLLHSLGTKNVERHHEECPGKGIDIEAIQKEL